MHKSFILMMRKFLYEICKNDFFLFGFIELFGLCGKLLFYELFQTSSYQDMYMSVE